MKKIAFIPIRSGSKGIKDKNIKEFNGKPLCYWTIRNSSESKSIDEVYVSTDSKKIIDIVESFQLPKVKTFLRSEKTSLDTSSTLISISSESDMSTSSDCANTALPAVTPANIISEKTILRSCLLCIV